MDINLQDDKDGNTALMWAIRKNLPEVTKKILKNKDVNINLQDKDGMTALMCAH